MAKKDNPPPLLTGFTNREGGKGKALSNPTTSMWLAIIFVAIFFALVSVQRNISKAEDALAPKDDGVKRSGYIVDAPDIHVLRDPPPNPDLLFPKQETAEEIIEEEIVLKNRDKLIEVRPIDVPIEIKIPESTLSLEVE